MKILVWEMRTSKGFTLMELSKKSGIGKSTINNIENGKVSPTWDFNFTMTGQPSGNQTSRLRDARQTIFQSRIKSHGITHR